MDWVRRRAKLRDESDLDVVFARIRERRLAHDDDESFIDEHFNIMVTY
jgi:hypothetical protein